MTTAAMTSSPMGAAPASVGQRTVRASVGAVLLLTLALYTYDLGSSGYANSFYSAAAQAGAESWKAFFFGSLDSGNAITVDKTPGSLWLMALSVRIFGLSSWSILLPQALLGVATAALLYVTVRRSLSGPLAERVGLAATSSRAHWAGIVAALMFALTPAATLMFRFNNPDALLVFCYAAAAALTLRAAETASRRWVAAAGAMIGIGFLAKMLQAFVLLPSLLIGYAIGAPASWRKKLVDLVAAFAAMVAAFGWWIAIVELVPASWRPYVGGSQNNSILELTFGYNGLGRLNGNEAGSVGGGPAGAGGRWGQTGIGRMFTTVSGEMVSWLIPAALVLAVAGFVLLGRRAWATTLRAGVETVETRAGAALALFASWLVINGAVFSFMAGIYHDYYTVALAPAIGGTVAIGATLAWAHRDRLLGRAALAVAALLTAAWAVALATVPGGLYLGITAGAAVILVGAAVTLLVDRLRAWRGLALLLAVVGALAGPAAYSVNTMLTPHTGSIVTAGPARTGLAGGQGGPGGPDGRDGRDGRRDGQMPDQDGRNQRMQPDGQNQPPAPPNGEQPGQDPGQGGQSGQPGPNQPGSAEDGRGPGGQGGPGGLLGGARVSSEMVTLLSADADRYTWVAATTGAQNAASYQLASRQPVMAIGGFNGSDPYPSLEQFQRYVAEGRIHYFIGGVGGGGPSGRTAGQIATWVAQNYTATTVGSVSVYDLTAAK